MLMEYDFSLNEPISIIGDFTTGETVNIELWVDGAAQNISPSGCDEINGTGKYGWSTGNIGLLRANRVQYHWRMSSNLGDTVEGDFVLYSTESEDGGGVPRDQSSYIKVI